MATNSLRNDLFASLISDIKSYSGKDPLLPWLRGIRKLRESLPPQLLKEKLPRFLQKCAQTFESDRRYRNDLRYLRVWLQLMDFVDDPRALLRTMEANFIGTKRSLFYQAYALYYEKIKKFEEAEKMYHLGVQNLAEPVEELQKSYEQFLHRVERQKSKRIHSREGRISRRPLSTVNIAPHCDKTEEKNKNKCGVEDRQGGDSFETMPNDKNVEAKKIPKESSQNVSRMYVSESSCNVATGGDQSMKKELIGNIEPRSNSKPQLTKRESPEPKTIGSDDTVVVKFVDTAIVGKSELAEDACHHGLVDPTINMKEAMNAINSMFREPLESAPVSRRSERRHPKEDNSLKNGLRVFIDENLDNGIESSAHKEGKGFSLLQQHSRTGSCQPLQEPFKIFIDDEDISETGDRNDDKDELEQSEVQNLRECSETSPSRLNVFVFPSPKDFPFESSDDLDAESSPRAKFREDTVVGRFVGSTILDEPEVENVCHHGLVDPTINLKEAMDDINGMFGKPIDFVRTRISKKQNKAPERKNDFVGFSILPDDDLEHQRRQLPPKSSAKSRDCDLFEPTMCTKEAMDDINKMFGMPLDC